MFIAAGIVLFLLFFLVVVREVFKAHQKKKIFQAENKTRLSLASPRSVILTGGTPGQFGLMVLEKLKSLSVDGIKYRGQLKFFVIESVMVTNHQVFGEILSVCFFLENTPEAQPEFLRVTEIVSQVDSWPPANSRPVRPAEYQFSFGSRASMKKNMRELVRLFDSLAWESPLEEKMNKES